LVNKLKILFLSKESDSSGLWYQCHREGAEVWAYIKEPWARKAMDEIVPKVETISEGLKYKPDVIVVDQNFMGEECEKLRKDGYRVVGGSKLAERLEFDRNYGISVAKQFGLSVPEYQKFSSVDDAIAYVKKQNQAFAIKIDHADSEASSYVAKDATDMVDYLSYAKEKKTIKPSSTFVIQKKIEGTEVSNECFFFDGTPILSSINTTFESKFFQSEGYGVRTGAEVSLVCHFEGHSDLYDATIRRLLPLLKHTRWNGPIDSNSIVEKGTKKCQFLEFTPRFGYSAIFAYMAMLGMPISQFFYQISRGVLEIPYKATWATSLKLSIPPYPTSSDDPEVVKKIYSKIEGVKINGEYGKDFIPIDVKKGDRTELMCAGVTGIIGECLGRGNSVLEAWRASQKVSKSVEAPNKQCRYVDGMEGLWKRVMELRNMGFNIPKPISAEGGKELLPLSNLKPSAV
jgi:phosphoribosylamine-glycine ligase